MRCAPRHSHRRRAQSIRTQKPHTPLFAAQARCSEDAPTFFDEAASPRPQTHPPPKGRTDFLLRKRVPTVSEFFANPRAGATHEPFRRPGTTERRATQSYFFVSECDLKRTRSGIARHSSVDSSNATRELPREQIEFKKKTDTSTAAGAGDTASCWRAHAVGSKRISRRRRERKKRGQISLRSVLSRGVERAFRCER